MNLTRGRAIFVTKGNWLSVYDKFAFLATRVRF